MRCIQGLVSAKERFCIPRGHGAGCNPESKKGKSAASLCVYSSQGESLSFLGLKKKKRSSCNQGLPGSSDGKESTSNAEALGLIPVLGRYPGGGQSTYHPVTGWSSWELVLYWGLSKGLCWWSGGLLTFVGAESSYIVWPNTFCISTIVSTFFVNPLCQPKSGQWQMVIGQVILSASLTGVSFAIDALWLVSALTCANSRNFTFCICSHKAIHSTLTWIPCHQLFHTSYSKS